MKRAFENIVVLKNHIQVVTPKKKPLMATPTPPSHPSHPPPHMNDI